MSQASAIKLHPSTVVKLFPLTSQPMGESKIFLGSPLTSHYIIVGEEWQTLTRLSYAPITPERIFNALRKASPNYFDFRYGIESIQVMLLHLIEHNLVEKVGDQTIHCTQKEGVNSLEIPKWPKYFISKVHLILYILLASLAILFPLFNPKLIPLPSDFFWYRYISFSFLTYFSLNWISGVIHEMAHYIVSGSQGVKSKMEISHRLNFVVLQTRFPNIFSIPRKWRIATFLAGLVMDLMLISITYMAITADLYGYISMPVWLFRLLKQFVLLQWLTVGWQFLFYMKTDIYFALREIVDINNLYTYAQLKILSIVKRQKFPFNLPKKEKFYVNLYAVFFVIGTAFAVIRYFFYYIPILFELIRGAYMNFIDGSLHSDFFKILDGIVVVTLQVFAFVILVYTLYEENRVSITGYFVKIKKNLFSLSSF